MTQTETLPLHHNQPEYSVSEISNILKRTVEENFSYIRVRGEISGLKIAPSGHIYFSLKDKDALIAAICWKGTASKMPIKLEEGLEIVCVGSITTYAMQSKYQLIVEKFEIAGIGALMALLAKRKELLAKEGLFDLANKKKLPKFPGIIGVITSPTGAVIRDILHRLSDRMPVHVLIWPTLVQGELAAGQIAAAIKGFNQMTDHRPDLLIVARGGGSIEDLWPFNEEIVVRAAASSDIPLISAVGHETDTTLIDYASDFRAPTPTAAAEIAVPVRTELLLQLGDYQRRMAANTLKMINTKSNFLQAIKRGLPNCTGLLNTASQRLDDIAIRLGLSLPRFAQVKNNWLNLIFARLKHPANIIAAGNNLLLYSKNNLNRAASNALEQYLHKLQLTGNNLKVAHLNMGTKLQALSHLTSLLNSYHYKKVLERGFAIIKDDGNKVITSASNIHKGKEYSVEMKDGVVRVVKA
jgi:exodeoxyribonuclease VII large subunit